MGKIKPYTIETIMGGMAEYEEYNDKTQFSGSVGLDPDLPTGAGTAGSRLAPSGMLVPPNYNTYSSTELTNYVRNIVTTPKDTNLYHFLADGRILTYSSTFGSPATINAQVTITNASPAVCTSTAHGLTAGSAVRFVTDETLPTGLSAGTTYYVIATGLTADDFQVSATVGGSAINTSSAGSGTHYIAIGSNEGSTYYNNYIYTAGEVDIARYGPIDGTPAWDHAFWRNTLSLTGLGGYDESNAPSIPTYPTFRGIQLPSHPMREHVDGFLYIGDYDNSSATAANRGKGIIHRLGTKYGTSGTAHQGAVNDQSAYNVLDLKYDVLPTDINTYGTDVGILGISNTDGTIVQGNSNLFLWTPIISNDSYYNHVKINDPVATALLNHNGQLIIFSGSMGNGVRVSEYVGGDSLDQIRFHEDSGPPTCNAVASLGNRIVFGGYTTYPSNSASVFALGYKHKVKSNALHNIINTKATATGSTGMVSALKYSQHQSFTVPRLAVGWIGNSNTYGMDRLSGNYGTAVFRSNLFLPGTYFQVKKVKIPLGAAVGANMTITPKIYTDNEVTAHDLTVINDTNYANSEVLIVDRPHELYGENNFLLELTWTGTAKLPVKGPIEITVEEFDENQVTNS